MGARILVATLAAFLLLLVPVGAATVDVTLQGNNIFRDAQGRNAWFQRVTTASGSLGWTGAAGMFRLTATRGDGTSHDFLAVGLDPG